MAEISLGIAGVADIASGEELAGAAAVLGAKIGTVDGKVDSMRERLRRRNAIDKKEWRTLQSVCVTGSTDPCFGWFTPDSPFTGQVWDLRFLTVGGGDGDTASSSIPSGAAVSFYLASSKVVAPPPDLDDGDLLLAATTVFPVTADWSKETVFCDSFSYPILRFSGFGETKITIRSVLRVLQVPQAIFSDTAE